MKLQTCPNFNHRNSRAPVRFCPNCGDVVNAGIPIKHCQLESHATARMSRNKFCVDCGEQLIR